MTSTTIGQANLFRLLPHQRREVTFLQEHPRALLLSGTGTGKTVTLLTRAGQVLSEGGRVLYVTTKSAEGQVHAEATKWMPEDQQPVRLSSGDEGAFVTCTHGLAQRRLSALKGRGPFDLLIVDEASVIGGGGANPQHKTYMALRALSHAASSAVVATAEPLGSAHALDLWAVADVAGISGLPDRAAMNGHVQWQEYQQGRFTNRVPVAISNEGFRLLLSIIRPHQIRTVMGDVARLPDVAVVHHPVALSGAAEGLYRAASGQSGLDGHVARQAASRDAESLIPEVLRLLAEDYSEHESVIVFSDMFDIINPLGSALRKTGITFVQIDGSTTAKDREQALATHRTGAARVLLMTEAGEAGLNAQHASLLISVVQSYSPARESQRVGRIRRIGTRHSALVHAIVRPDVGHEVRRERILQGKEQLIDAMWKAFA